MAPMTLLTQEPLTFAPHTPVDEWLATQDVAKWREKWLRDGFVVVKGFVDPNEVVYREFTEKLLRCGGRAGVSLRVAMHPCGHLNPKP